jgi:predicted N-acetyltransferase YhbS
MPQMHSTALKVFSPVEEKHACAIIDLCAKTFGSYFITRRGLASGGLLGSHYDWQASAVGAINDHLVTHFGVWNYQMRVGGARLRSGGIGYVATHGDHRKQGLMAQTIPHSLKQMRALGYDFSLLFGIHDFYSRFGYVRAWNEASWIIRLEQLPADLPAPAYEKRDAAVSAEAIALHNRQNAALTGTAVRPTYPGLIYGSRGLLSAYAWKDKAGKLAGQVLAHASGTRLICTEVLGDPDLALAVLAAVAREKVVGEIQFDTLHYLSPMARRLRTLSCRYECNYVRDGAAMARVINLSSAMEKLRPELERRLAASACEGFSGSLTLASSEEAVQLTLSRGRLGLKPGSAKTSAAIRAGSAAAQLLLGTEDAMTVCEMARVRVRPEAARLLAALFPAQHPQLHLADRF